MVAACPEGYRQELARIDAEIASLGAGALDGRPDTELVTRYVSLRYQRASLAGDLRALHELERDINRAVALVPNKGDLYLLKANLLFKLHRLDDAEASLKADPHAFASVEGLALRADLDFQLGLYDSAREQYEKAVSVERKWDTLARLAHFTSKMVGDAEADRLYEGAEDELTAKEMRAYAWLEVQRGFLHFTRGRYDDAAAHYQRAAAAYPGYWFVDEYEAELFGAQGRHDDAIAIFQRIAGEAPRPDLKQAIGELYALKGDHEHARSWGGRAVAEYLDSVQRGEVHYWHHLAEYYSEVADDGAAAVLWARVDVATRDNFSTQSALAWAFYRADRLPEALDWIDRALASGVVDARLLWQASRIHEAAGQGATAREYERRALDLNPHVGSFHVHH